MELPTVRLHIYAYRLINGLDLEIRNLRRYVYLELRGHSVNGRTRTHTPMAEGIRT